MMNYIAHFAVAAALVVSLSGAATAQVPLGTPAQAIAEAQARLVCGTGTVVDATYVPGGLLRATCRAQARTAQNSRLPTELQGTGLSSGAAVGAGALLVVVVASGGGSGGTTTTTSTTSTGGGGYVAE